MDLTGQLSNPSAALRQMLEGEKPQVSRPAVSSEPVSAKQQQGRPSDTQKAELVQRHRDGAFKKELARAYGIHVETVRAIIRRSLQAG